MEPIYDEAFFDAIRTWARESAAVIVPLVLHFTHPKSVIDVGCGSGEWLAEFAEHGIADYIGIDANPPSNLSISRERFTSVDLADPFSLEREFDLAVSLEIGEHLPTQRAAGFVADLCHLAPAIVFSAAIPGQGGNGHINEQWPSWWCELFKEHGFGVRDVIRPIVWTDERVTWFYAQNILIFERGAETSASMLDIVHPQLLRAYTATPDVPPTPLRVHLRALPGALRRAVKSRLL
jgi:SAM-dependent methyltransferase